MEKKSQNPKAKINLTQSNKFQIKEQNNLNYLDLSYNLNYYQMHSSLESMKDQSRNQRKQIDFMPNYYDFQYNLGNNFTQNLAYKDSRERQFQNNSYNSLQSGQQNRNLQDINNNEIQKQNRNLQDINNNEIQKLLQKNRQNYLKLDQYSSELSGINNMQILSFPYFNNKISHNHLLTNLNKLSQQIIIKEQNEQKSLSYNQNFNYLQKQQSKQSKSTPQNNNDQLFQIQKKRKKQKYKRSTNNSHKKFISAIRRLFFAVISTKEKDYFQTKYVKYRSCRTFFFIILAYMKYRFSLKLLNSVKASFIHEMELKISEYQEEITRTKNINLKNFRQQEIIDIKYSIKSCNQYFKGNTRQAIESMYKKDKSTIIKRQHYEAALKSVHMIEKELSKNQIEKLEQPYVEDYSYSTEKDKEKQKQKIKKKTIKRALREVQIERNNIFMPFIPSLNNNINKGSINMRNINMFDNSLNFAKNDKNNQISQNYEKSNVYSLDSLNSLKIQNFNLNNYNSKNKITLDQNNMRQFRFQENQNYNFLDFQNNNKKQQMQKNTGFSYSDLVNLKNKVQKPTQISEKGVKNTIDLKAIQDEMLGKTKDKQLAISSSSQYPQQNRPQIFSQSASLIHSQLSSLQQQPNQRPRKKINTDNIDTKFNIKKKADRATFPPSPKCGHNRSHRRLQVQSDRFHDCRPLYPPLLEIIPYYKYDPYNPPYALHSKREIQYDNRQDFFGFMRYGFPVFAPNFGDNNINLNNGYDDYTNHHWT